MKKIKILIIIFIFTCLTGQNVYADDVAVEFINSDIGEQAIQAPLSLPVWHPPYYVTPVYEKGQMDVFKKTTEPVLAEKGLVKKQQNASEEILYNIDFINSKETPIYSDTEIFIKIPKELKYSESSLSFNDQKLTDELDKDRLTFLQEDNTLKISLNGVNKNKRITIVFVAKPLVSDIAPNIPYCLIKFQSKLHKSQFDWKPFSTSVK